jgi:3-hydroxyisobutyrate dehydrogenase-like beta-hydroxyacid dehydrogenase
MDKQIGIIGLGRIGIPAVKAFLQAGYQVYGYDRQSPAMEALESMGGTSCSSPGQMAQTVDTILILVLNDMQVEEVITGENGILSSGKKPLIVCMSTINRHTLIGLAQLCAAEGIDLVDCPFTGGPARIPAGNLTLIAAAPKLILERARPFMEVIGKITFAGEKPGLGQAIKHCNQLLVGSTHAATMEVIQLARTLGLDDRLVVDIVGSGIAGSDYFRLLSDSVLNGSPSPGGLGQMCKDVSIVVNTTREVKMPALVATAMSQYFIEAESRGMQSQEGADLIKILQKDSKL